MSIQWKSMGSKQSKWYRYFSKYLLLCYTEESKSYRFGMTVGRVNEYRFLIFLYFIPIICLIWVNPVLWMLITDLLVCCVLHQIITTEEAERRGVVYISRASPTCLIWTMWMTSTPSMRLIMETSLTLSTTAWALTSCTHHLGYQVIWNRFL